MSEAHVRSKMGDGDAVCHKKIQFVDPWRSEAFHLEDGTAVTILFYVTQSQVKPRVPPGCRPADVPGMVQQFIGAVRASETQGAVCDGWTGAPPEAPLGGYALTIFPPGFYRRWVLRRAGRVA